MLLVFGVGGELTTSKCLTDGDSMVAQRVVESRGYLCMELGNWEGENADVKVFVGDGVDA